MSRRQSYLSSATVALAVVIAALGQAGAQTIQVSKENRTIAITATDTATADADIATVHIGFQTFAPDSGGAYSQGSTLSNAIVDALKQAGVPAGSIESESQDLRRNEQFDEKLSAFDRAQRQFVLEQSWTVHTPAADAARVLHLAIEAGANNSGAIDWDVTDRKPLQAKAAASALAKAQSIATQMATTLNVTLKGLIYASNQAQAGGIRPMAMSQMLRIVPQKQLKPLAIDPKRIEEDATIYAVFAIE